MKFDFQNNEFTDLEFQCQKIAISGSDRDINWEDSKKVVDQYIAIFSNLGLPKGHPVIVYGHKEHLFPLAILALMRCDLPYIPVDNIYPFERLIKIQSVSGSQVLINCGDYLIDDFIPIVINNHFEVEFRFNADFSNGIVYRESDPLRYILFTSGSTGEPKGVQITRSSLNCFCNWIKTSYPFTADDVFLNQSLFTFDVSLYDIVGAFLHGGTILLIDIGLTKESDRLFRKLRKYKCSVWVSTPSFAYIYLRETQMNQNYLDCMKIFLFAGENLPVHVVEGLHRQFPDSKVFNAYGPTEATVTTTLVEVSAEMVKSSCIPIGYPRPDSVILIENESNDPEKTGELIIVGDHVSIGYLKDETLSSEKFFTFRKKRAFRTGDLGYYSDNMLYFTGRNDDMIKFHGYRIELGEISAVIREMKFIEDAVTIPLKRGEDIKRIISIVVLTNSDSEYTKDWENALKSHLEKKLPSYMLPADIIKVDKFPLNANQKIDKAALIEIYKSLKSSNRT
ncbi:MAG: AMP-binding protein [Bacteroidetes bacterium]|nr:AMP-binding protein [Bacteroidota bacterium]